MEAIVLIVLWLSGALALDEPQNIVVLLADPDGKVGKAEIINSAGSQRLETAGTVVRIANQTTAPKAPKAISAADIDKIFGAALKVMPVPPKTILLFFRSGTSILTAESQKLLKEIVSAFQSRKLPRANVIGHTDTIGRADGNFKLALRRANGIRQQLIDAGMNAAGVAARSHGESDPIIKTADSVDEEQNRRVEVTIW